MQSIPAGSFFTTPVEFTATRDLGKGKEVFLFARVCNKDYYVGHCPYLESISSLFTSSVNTKIEDLTVKIARNYFPTNTNEYSDFFRYLLDRQNFEKSLIEEAQAGNVHLPKAILAPYSPSKKERVVTDLVVGITEGDKKGVDRAIRTGAAVNETFFICSGGGIFTSKNAINNHLCKPNYKSDEYRDGGATTTTYYSYTESRELTPLSYASLKNQQEIITLLSQQGATKRHNTEFNFETRTQSYWYDTPGR